MSSARTSMVPKRSFLRLRALSARDDAAVEEGDVHLLLLAPEVQHAGLLLLADELEDVGDAEVLERALERHQLASDSARAWRRRRLRSESRCSGASTSSSRASCCADSGRP